MGENAPGTAFPDRTKLQLLLEAIEGGDINDVYRRLRRIDGTQTYELIREGMTDSFFESLRGVRGRFGSLYVCSPWINASDRALRNLHFAVLEHQSRTTDLPELFVVTRPSNNSVEKDKLDPFRSLHAKIFYLPKLHSKLYIREPDKSGGTMLAIVGSQNLTRSRYLELGVRINGDDQLIRQLIRYFMDLTNISSETDSGQTSPKE